MPIQRCRKDGKLGWQWGNRTCYIGSAARSRAIKQGQAVRASGWTGNVRGIRTTIARTNPQKSDPTRTKMLRRKFERDLSRRFTKLRQLIVQLVAVEDAFGLKKPGPFNEEQSDGHADNIRRGNGSGDSSRVGIVFSVCELDGISRSKTLNKRFAFQSTPQQVASFELWLREQIGTVLTSERDMYWDVYVREGYEKGAGRAFSDTYRARRAQAGSAEQMAYYEGTKEEFLSQVFGQAESIEKVQLLASRTLTDLKGVGDAMATRMSRILTDGLVAGANPWTIARTMSKDLGIDQRRALTIARTEIIRAHAEGQLDAMERMGVEKVGVMVEWSSAGDDRVCPLCQDLDGVVLKISEARGLIPRHPNCRCAHVPAQVGEPRDTTRRVNYGDGTVKVGQKRTKSGIEAAIRGSVGKERAKGTLQEKLRKSRWPGADKAKTIAKVRPKSPLYPPGRERVEVSPRKVIPRKPSRRVVTPKPIAPRKPSRVIALKPTKPPVLKPKPKPTVAKTKTDKLREELARRKSQSEALKKQLAETRAKTRVAEKQLADANKKAAKEKVEVARLKKEIQKEKDKVKAIDKRMKAQDKLHEAEIKRRKPTKRVVGD